MKHLRAGQLALIFYYALLELGIYTGCFGGMSVVYNVYIADLRFLLN